MTRPRIPAAVRRALKARGINPSDVRVRVNPDAPTRAERVSIRAASDKARDQVRALVKRKQDLIAAFLREDPEASRLVADLDAAVQHRDVVQARLHRHRAEVLRDIGFAMSQLASGDSLAEVWAELSRGKG